MLGAHEAGVKERLKIIVAVLGEAVLREDGIHIGQWLAAREAGLVVHHADALLSVAVRHLIQPVYASADGGGEGLLVGRRDSHPAHHVALQSEDGERRETPVELQ